MLSPAGRHVPTLDEWDTLELAVCSGSSCATDFPYDKSAYGWRGITEGAKLKENCTLHGLIPNYATNETGFSSLGGGERYGFYPGAFGYIGYFCGYWSATEFDPDYAWCRNMEYDYAKIDRDGMLKKSGWNVRCSRDLSRFHFHRLTPLLTRLKNRACLKHARPIIYFGA